MKSIGVCVVGVWVGVVVLAHEARAGRPLTMDDADPVDSCQFEWEMGAVYEQDSDVKHGDLPFGLTYGWIRGMEIGLGFGGQWEERTDVLEPSGSDETWTEESIGDLFMAAKWLFVPNDPLGARHAFAPSVKFPTADDEKGLGSGEIDYDLTWMITRSLGERSNVHGNLGYSWIGGSDDNVVHYGWALDYQLGETVQWVGEVFAEKELAHDADTVIQYNTGFRWTPSENWTWDIAGGSAIDGDAPDFTATVGLTAAFGSGHGTDE